MVWFESRNLQWSERNLTKNARFIRMCSAMPGISWGIQEYTRHMNDGKMFLKNNHQLTAYQLPIDFAPCCQDIWWLWRHTREQQETSNPSSAVCYIPSTCETEEIRKSLGCFFALCRNIYDLWDRQSHHPSGHLPLPLPSPLFTPIRSWQYIVLTSLIHAPRFDAPIIYRHQRGM